MLKLLLTLCQYDCVICISDVCDNLSIDVYSPSIFKYFSYQVFRVNVEQTWWHYTTLSNASRYCNFVFIAQCGFLLEVKTWFCLFLCLVLRLSIGIQKTCHAEFSQMHWCNQWNKCTVFFAFPDIFPLLFATDILLFLVLLPALNPYWQSLSCCSMMVQFCSWSDLTQFWLCCVAYHLKIRSSWIWVNKLFSHMQIEDPNHLACSKMYMLN